MTSLRVFVDLTVQILNPSVGFPQLSGSISALECVTTKFVNNVPYNKYTTGTPCTVLTGRSTTMTVPTVRLRLRHENLTEGGLLDFVLFIPNCNTLPKI
jgi:hypothetical protein